MKKCTLAFLAMVLLAGTAFSQGKSKGWPEMKTFHSYMAATFHPSEDGDLKPLKEKADSLYAAAQAWQNSAIPEDYKMAETKATLKDLVSKCARISKLVKTNDSDDELKKEIAEAHEIFHKVVGECRKSDEHEGHGH